MSKSYPETIPSRFKSEEECDAYRTGWNSGHGIACHNVPTLGETYHTYDLGCVTCDAENIRDIHQDFCFAAELNARDYSPWEHVAHAFNSSDNAEALWEAYEAGVGDSIFADLEEYTDEDYGIETEGDE